MRLAGGQASKVTGNQKWPRLGCPVAQQLSSDRGGARDRYDNNSNNKNNNNKHVCAARLQAKDIVCICLFKLLTATWGDYYYYLPCTHEETES